MIQYSDPYILRNVEIKLSILDDAVGAMKTSISVDGESVDFDEIDRSNTVYVSGPMTGIENLNKEAFIEAAEILSAYGFDVLNPSTYHKPNLNWEHYLQVDCIVVEHCSSVCVLQGWENSVGACIEVTTAVIHQLPVFELLDDGTFGTLFLPGEDGLAFLKEVMHK